MFFSVQSLSLGFVLWLPSLLGCGGRRIPKTQTAGKLLQQGLVNWQCSSWIFVYWLASVHGCKGCWIRKYRLRPRTAFLYIHYLLDLSYDCKVFLDAVVGGSQKRCSARSLVAWLLWYSYVSIGDLLYSVQVRSDAVVDEHQNIVLD